MNSLLIIIFIAISPFNYPFACNPKTMMRKKSSAENSQGSSPTKISQGITLTQEFLVMKTR